MSDTIRNQDGSVYMTFGPSVPSSSDLEGWLVRHLCSGSHHPGCSHGPESTGTWTVDRSDVESFNGVLKIVGAMSNAYGYTPRSSKILDGTFRWTFEREYADGHRGSDMIIASKIV